MDSKKDDPSYVAAVVYLATVRDDLQVPTSVAALLAQAAGARLYMVRPGRVEADLPGLTVHIRVRVVNPHRAEARAYCLADEPVPDHVLQAADLWDREHGGQR